MFRRIGSGSGFAYWGDRDGWSIALSVHRDSNTIERSNWSVITADVLAVQCSDGHCDEHIDGLADAAVEHTSHAAVGWLDYLLVRPGSSAERRAQYWANKLAAQCIADEHHWSTLEYDEEWCVRCDSATRDQHPTVRCAKFRSADDASEIQYRWDHRGE